MQLPMPIPILTFNAIIELLSTSILIQILAPASESGSVSVFAAAAAGSASGSAAGLAAAAAAVAGSAAGTTPGSVFRCVLASL